MASPLPQLISFFPVFANKFHQSFKTVNMTIFAWNSQKTTTFGVTLGITTAVLFLPLMSYFLYQYYGYRNNVMLKKRYSSLTIIQVILCGLLDLGLSIFELSIVGIFSQDTNANLLITAISAMVSLMCSAGVANLLLFRDWLIIFDNNFAMATRKRIEWQLLINSSHTVTNDNKPKSDSQSTTNWWLLHKNNFGNYYFVSKIVLIKIAVECLIIAVPWCYVLSQEIYSFILPVLCFLFLL